MIGKIWFHHLDSYGEREYSVLKEEINGKTLIGEYVGSAQL
jgi:hypothetical protein